MHTKFKCESSANRLLNASITWIAWMTFVVHELNEIEMNAFLSHFAWECLHSWSYGWEKVTLFVVNGNLCGNYSVEGSSI